MNPIRFAGLLLLFFAAGAAQALTSQHDLLLDLDARPGTGCSVATPDGPFNGVEVVLSTTVETDGLSLANVIEVMRRECIDPSTDTFGAPVNLGGGWPVGVGQGLAGFHVIETSTPVPSGLRFHGARIGVVASNELGDSATLLGVNGAPIYLRGLPPLPVPVVAGVALLALALALLLLGLLVLGRRGRLTLTSVVLLSGAGAAGAGAVYSGVLAEWSPDDLLAETSASDPEGGVEIRAVFGQRSGDGLTAFFRLDSALMFAAAPVAQADTYATELTTPVSEAAADGLLANDDRGLPAAELASFGGGDLAGAVTDHAAGASVPVGADGNLTVNTDGSFEFRAETGFDGPFTFDYRLENVAGTADGTVTVGVQRSAGAVDDAFEVLSGQALDTGSGALLANDTGWPAPQVSAFGGGDLGGAVDDHAAGESVTVGADGSLTVNADGQLMFLPASGSTGGFTFDYRIDNPAGTDTGSVTVTINDAPAITSAGDFTCAVGSACAFTFTADGYPAPALTVAGALPAGVTFNAGTESLEGSPQAGSGDVYTLTVTAANGTGTDAEQTFSLTVNEPPTITSANSLGCEVGGACDFAFTADGHPDPTFSLPGLPAGLSLNAATGELSGQPDIGTGGEYNLVLEAGNSEGSDSQNFTLTIGQVPEISSAADPTCEVGQACSFSLAATGFPDPDFTLPGLPSGLSLDGVSGQVSGIPDAGTGQVYELTVTAQNSVGSDSQAFQLTVNETPAITSANSLTCRTGQACDFIFEANGFPVPTFNIVEPLPDGLSLDGASGALSGSPAGDAGGVYVLSLSASNGVGVAPAQTFTLTVEQPPAITSAASLTCEAGSACNLTVTADGYPDPTFTLPGLPSGLNFDGVSGAISGTPAAGTGGIYNLTLTATSGVAPDATQSFELTVNDAPAITSATATTCQAEQSCAFTFMADGHPDPTFGIAETLPSGLSLDAATGQLSGTPVAGAGGEYALTVEAANGISPAATQAFTLTIGEAPTMTSADNVTCEVGASCSFAFAATGYPDPNILVAGSMASGVTFNAATDSLTGIPDVGSGGVYTLDIDAANGFAPDAGQSFTLTVNETPQAVDDPNGGIPADSSPGSMPYHGSLDTTLVVGAASGVLANDQLGHPQASIDSLTTTSTAGGSVTLAADGGFSYQPPAGFTGIDVFTYCLDNGVSMPLPCANVELAVGERPSASDASFAETLIGNTDIDTARSSGYSLYNLAAGDQITVSLVTASNGDAVVNSTTGTFSFDPAAGFNGSATLEYQVSNGFAETPTGTVTFSVDDMIWYYDNTAAAGGDGRLSSPFNSLAGASASSTGDIHFVYAGSGDYTGGIVLLGGQVLIGQQGAGMLSSFLAPSVPADSALPSTGATPLIVNAAGAGVTLGTNNILRGFNVGNTSGFGVLGSAFGSLAVDDVSITDSGSGLSLDTGTVTGSGFDQVNATLGSHGILLTAVDGTVALGSGAVSGATTAALELNGGTASVSYGGSLQPAAGGRPLLVQNKTGGLVELTGAVSSTALGVRVAANSATTTRLAGGLDLVTGANPAFKADQGGIVEVCDDNPCNPGVIGGLVNTLSTTTGVALDVANTTIGGNNLEFRSISAGTGTTGPASGIVLESTGSTGGLKVRGTGPAGSGGTIQNSTASGVALLDAHNIELASMTVSGSGEHGIDGTLVADFELVEVDVTGNGDAANEEGINFVNLSGAVSLIDVLATGNAYHNLRIDNDSGTITSLVISGGSYSNNDPTLGNHGILITPRGSSVISSAFVDGVTVSGNYSMGMQVATADNAAVNSFVVSNSTFEDNELGLDFSKAQTSSIAFNIDNNLFTAQNSHGLNVFTAAGGGTTGSLSGVIRNNTVGQAGVDGSGSVIGNCMRVNINGDTDAAIRVDNNILRECPNGRGLEVIGRNGTGGLDVTVVNNDIDHVNLAFSPGTSDFPLAAIMVQSNCATVCNTVRSDVRNNTVPTGSASDFTSGFITLTQSNSSVLQLVDTATASADCASQLTETNTGSIGVTGSCALISGPIDSP